MIRFIDFPSPLARSLRSLYDRVTHFYEHSINSVPLSRFKLFQLTRYLEPLQALFYELPLEATHQSSFLSIDPEDRRDQGRPAVNGQKSGGKSFLGIDFANPLHRISRIFSTTRSNVAKK